jgi:DNA-3-methyladenine glycosylase II
VAVMDTRAYTELARREPVLAELISSYGEPAAFEWHDGGRTGSSQFAAMLLHIVGQQISAASAFTIYDRIRARSVGVPTAEAVLELGVDALHACGLSEAKAGYATALAQAQLAGTLDIENLGALNDQEAIDRLTRVRGIGLWSAQTFLVHNLGRPDVLPESDNGIRKAIRRLWQLDAIPTLSEVCARGEAWAPYRSYAAALLWRSLAPVDQLSDPKERALANREGGKG